MVINAATLSSSEIPYRFDVCVLIPYYQNLAGLKVAVKSIAYPTGNLVIVVVDDGSSEPLKASDLTHDLGPNLKLFVVRQSQNSGITQALNAGIQFIQTKLRVPFIARLDCGDTCTPDRFEKQMTFLKNNPEVKLLGSWCIFKDPASGFSYTYTTPTEHFDIQKELHYRNVFIHPTVMFRTSILKEIGFYPNEFPEVEDYAFFMRIAEKYKTAILPEFLVCCEINAKGLSISRRQKQLRGRAAVVKSFGKRPLLVKLGLGKLWFLQQIPYNFILRWKAFVSRRS